MEFGKPYNYIYSKAEIIDLLKNKQYYSDSVYKTFFSEYLKKIGDLLNVAKTNRIEIDNLVKNVYKQIALLDKAMEDKDISINQRAINLGLPLFCATTLLLFIFAYWYQN